MNKAPISRKSLAMMRGFLVERLTDDEILEKTGWDAEKLEEIRSELIGEEEISVVNRRTGDVYVRYILATERNLKDLDDLIGRLFKDPTNRNAPAMVSAVKAKQELLDRVLTRGQEFGFIDKRPEEKSIVVGRLDDAALASHVARQLLMLKSLVEKNSGKTLLDVREAELIDVSPSRTDGQLTRVDPVRPAQEKSERPNVAQIAPPVVRRKVVAPSSARERVL